MNAASKQRIHPFRRAQIARISADRALLSRCSEFWVFGSAVDGCSEKPHTVFSDIDFAIMPKMSVSADINTPECREINERIMDDLTDGGQTAEYDIVWLNRMPAAGLLENIRKGVRLV